MPVFPHHPYSLQQLPNVDPEHVNPWVPLQLPSVETFEEGVEEVADVAEDGADDEAASLVTLTT